jgi:hypothetical protein
MLSMRDEVLMGSELGVAGVGPFIHAFSKPRQRSIAIIVMDRYDSSLPRAVENGKSFRPHLARTWTEKVTRLILECRVLHIDSKEDNVMFRGAPVPTDMVLSDFGLSYRFHSWRKLLPLPHHVSTVMGRVLRLYGGNKPNADPSDIAAMEAFVDEYMIRTRQCHSNPVQLNSMSSADVWDAMQRIWPSTCWLLCDIYLVIYVMNNWFTRRASGLHSRPPSPAVWTEMHTVYMAFRNRLLSCPIAINSDELNTFFPYIGALDLRSGQQIYTAHQEAKARLESNQPAAQIDWTTARS